MSESLVTLGGILAIAGIVWWFRLSKPKAVRAMPHETAEIRVAGGVYQPAALEVPAGEPITLRFLRTDASSCTERVVFASLGISQYLPLNQIEEIVLPPLAAGTVEFTCQMGMVRGKLIVS